MPPSLSTLLTGGEADYNAYSYGGGERNYDSGGQSGYDNKNNFKLVCINNNNNTVIEEEPPLSQTASLTVNKEIYGCDNPSGQQDPGAPIMLCEALQDDSPEWIQCDDPDISDTMFCQRLTEDLFDIEVLDDQNNQIEQFEGSVEGTTLENLEPGTYTVNEIVNPDLFITNELVQYDLAQNLCIDAGFDDGGFLFLQQPPQLPLPIHICFEYEDEQGNDCSTITLAAGEERTCTVKNYIPLGGV